MKLKPPHSNTVPEQAKVAPWLLCHGEASVEGLPSLQRRLRTKHLLHIYENESDDLLRPSQHAPEGVEYRPSGPDLPCQHLRAVRTVLLRTY